MEIRDRFFFRAVRDRTRFFIGVQNFRCRVLVRGLDPLYFVENINRAPRAVVIQPHKRHRVGIIAPVEALFDAIEIFYFFIGDFTDFQVLEHIPARARHLAEIFVFVRFRIKLFQRLRFVNKRLTEPFFRDVQIGGMQNRHALARL